MYALMIVIAITGIAAATLGCGGCLFALLDKAFDDDVLPNPRRVVPICAIAVVAGALVAIWGFTSAASIQREQCEAAGYEWITGTCYGSNVNVNEAR